MGFFFLVDTHWLLEARMLNFAIRPREDATILTYLGKGGKSQIDT